MKGAEPYPLPKVEDGEDEEPDLKALRRAQTLVATCCGQVQEQDQKWHLEQGYLVVLLIGVPTT